jgi:hypothetical protein
VLVLIGVVTDAALARERLDLGRGHGRALGQAEHDDFKGVQRPAQVAVAQHGEIGQNLFVRRDPARTESAFSIDQGLAQHTGNGCGGQRLETEEMAAREQRRVDVETGIVRGRADQAHTTLLDVGQEQILLRLVETVQLVDEKNRARLGQAARGGQDFAQLGNVGHDGVDAHKAGLGFAGDDLGE